MPEYILQWKVFWKASPFDQNLDLTLMVGEKVVGKIFEIFQIHGGSLACVLSHLHGMYF